MNTHPIQYVFHEIKLDDLVPLKRVTELIRLYRDIPNLTKYKQIKDLIPRLTYAVLIIRSPEDRSVRLYFNSDDIPTVSSSQYNVLSPTGPLNDGVYSHMYTPGTQQLTQLEEIAENGANDSEQYNFLRYFFIPFVTKRTVFSTIKPDSSQQQKNYLYQSEQSKFRVRHPKAIKFFLGTPDISGEVDLVHQRENFLKSGYNTYCQKGITKNGDVLSKEQKKNIEKLEKQVANFKKECHRLQSSQSLLDMFKRGKPVSTTTPLINTPQKGNETDIRTTFNTNVDSLINFDPFATGSNIPTQLSNAPQKTNETSISITPTTNTNTPFDSDPFADPNNPFANANNPSANEEVKTNMELIPSNLISAPQGGNGSGFTDPTDSNIPPQLSNTPQGGNETSISITPTTNMDNPFYSDPYADPDNPYAGPDNPSANEKVQTNKMQINPEDFNYFLPTNLFDDQNPQNNRSNLLPISSNLKGPVQGDPFGTNLIGTKQYTLTPEQMQHDKKMLASFGNILGIELPQNTQPISAPEGRNGSGLTDPTIQNTANPFLNLPVNTFSDNPFNDFNTNQYLNEQNLSKMAENVEDQNQNLISLEQKLNQQQDPAQKNKLIACIREKKKKLQAISKTSSDPNIN